MIKDNEDHSISFDKKIRYISFSHDSKYVYAVLID